VDYTIVIIDEYSSVSFEQIAQFVKTDIVQIPILQTELYEDSLYTGILDIVPNIKEVYYEEHPVNLECRQHTFFLDGLPSQPNPLVLSRRLEGSIYSQKYWG